MHGTPELLILNKYIKHSLCWFEFDGSDGISNAECGAQALTVTADGIEYPEHCSIDFSGLAKSAIEKAAKMPAQYAVTRGWLYQESQ